MSLRKNENIGVNLNRLEIDVDGKTFSDACERAYEKQKRRIRVPGFRQGKAPKKVIEKLHGEDVFYEEAIGFVYGKALDEAIAESKLDVVSVDDFNVISVNCKDGLYFSVNCTLKPDIGLKQYKGFEIKVPVRKVKEEDIKNQIENLRERAARIFLVEEDRAAEKGDLVVLDFLGFVDGISLKGGQAKDYNLKLGSKQFIDGFEDQVQGHKVGEEFDVNVKFPENYHEETLRGKDAVFKCKLKAIKRFELPKEDDEFAKDVSEFKTLKELKEDIKNKLEENNNNIKRNYILNDLLAKVVDNVEGEIPEVMFRNSYNRLYENFEKDLKRSRLAPDQYFASFGINEETFFNNMHMQAVFEVKKRLALEKIAKIENLEVKEEDTEKEFENLSKQYGIDKEELKKILPIDGIKEDLLINKAIEFVEKNAKIEEEEIK